MEIPVTLGSGLHICPFPVISATHTARANSHTGTEKIPVEKPTENPYTAPDYRNRAL